MNIIFNADDFGSSYETVEATIHCFELGALTSATIMPKMPGTASSVVFAKKHREFSFGVHLTFSCDRHELSVSNAKDIPALALEDGHFRKSNRLRLAAIIGSLPIKEIEQEIYQQLALMADYGVTISHVDSHGHLHKFEPFRIALKRTLPHFGIRRVRNIQDIYTSKTSYFSPTLWFGPSWRRKIMNDFITTDHFYMSSGRTNSKWANLLFEILKKQRSSNKTIEVGVHPGRAENWRRCEMEGLIECANRANADGHEFITWMNI